MIDTPAPLTIRSVLGDFAAFLRKPEIFDPQGWRGGGLKRWAIMTALLVFGLIVVLLPLLGAWQKAFDLPSPDAFGKMSKAWLVPVVVLIAPPIEELLFRGWQRGSASALWLLLCALAAVGTLLLVTNPAQALLVAAIFIALLVAAPAGWLLLRKHPAPMPWFARAFPLIFYAVAIGFALVHLTNYSSATLMAVPLVLPQLWAALVLGYLRQRLGLIPGIAAHMTANACSISLALLGG